MRLVGLGDYLLFGKAVRSGYTDNRGPSAGAVRSVHTVVGICCTGSHVCAGLSMDSIVVFQ